MDKTSRIKNFPVSFFSVVMGLAGLAIALQKAVDIFNIPKVIPLYALYFSVVVFCVIALFYLLKILLSRHEVIAEFNHPVKINFFPTFSISLLLLSVAFLPVSLDISRYFWYSGTILHFIITLLIIGTWMHHDKFKITHMNPSWFIPAVGNILIPVAGVTHAHSELSWFFFSFGLFFWIILLTIFFYRIFFHEALTEKLIPTLFILIAPPAVGFISYFKLAGEINDFSRILYYFAAFLTVLMATQLKIHSKIKYYLSWWAYSFPLAAISIATALMYHETKIIVYKYIFLVLLTSLALLVLLLLFKTISAIINRQICVEE
jgi:tellurite resistance protein